MLELLLYPEYNEVRLLIFLQQLLWVMTVSENTDLHSHLFYPEKYLIGEFSHHAHLFRIDRNIVMISLFLIITFGCSHLWRILCVLYYEHNTLDTCECEFIFISKFKLLLEST